VIVNTFLHTISKLSKFGLGSAEIKDRLDCREQDHQTDVRREEAMGDLGGELALKLTSDMLWTAVLICAPLIGITTLVGLLVSILQVVTQIQESSLAFVPKLIAAVAVLLVLGGWMLSTLSQYASSVIASIPNYF
jgi:flagellar biosynthesis protein FliQ